MKRQRGVSAVNGVNNLPRVEEVATMGKKKAKKEEEQKNTAVVVVVVKEEEGKENRDIGGSGLSQEKWGGVGMNWEEYMPWLGGVVDEQMSWSSTWFPAWDMDFMGEREAFNALCSDDVVWDYDIWNLKNQIPIPLEYNKRFDLE